MAKKITISIFVLCLVAIIWGGFALVRAQSFPKILDEYVLEAGNKLPNAQEFLLVPEGQVFLAFFTDKIDMVDTYTPGEYPIEILVSNVSYNQKIFDSVIKVVDTIPPQAAAVKRFALSGGAIKPDEFVTDITDVTAVSVDFAGTPDFATPGRRNINIILRDLGGNETVVSSELTVIGHNPVALEAGSPHDALSPWSFIDGSYETQGLDVEADLRWIDINRVGSYDISLRLGNSTGKTTLYIIDTTPPTAKPVAVEAWIGDDLDPMDFLTDVFDYSEVTPMLSDEPGFTPDFKKTGRQNVKIILIDAAQNSSEFRTTLRLRRDTQPPVISGEIHKGVFIGDSVAYRAGVIVSDNRDTNVSLSVDSSAVNVNVPGRYPVIYSATDRAGNHTTVKGSLTVYTVAEESVYAMVDEVLARIIDDDMSLEQKARKIFDWVRGNIGYVNASESDGIIFGAYRALTKRSGDCYTFFAISQLMLERAGVPSIPVERVGGNTRHYWQLIDVGEGWHHYDSTLWHVRVDTFMMTESRAQSLARQYQGRNYYNYDATLYPEVVP